MILALDISTSITGYAIIDEEGIVVRSGSVDLRKQKTFVGKVSHARNQIVQECAGF